MNRHGCALTLAVLIATLVLTLPAAVASAAAAAAEPAAAPGPADETATADPETAGGDTTTEPQAPEGADGDGPGDVFVPTEEISEDYAVSFPVDI